jgi:hypothetical protein
MRLKPAPGGPEMVSALDNRHVLRIVAILLPITDQDIFRDVALFLSSYTKSSQAYFKESLNDLRTSISPDEEGLFTTPSNINDLVTALEFLYKQNNEVLGYLRGAVVEQLTLQLISQRCLPRECVNNHSFEDNYGKRVTAQIDIAVLSYNKSEPFIEGYECKIKARGIQSEDCDNLRALVKAAHDENSYVYVGVVSFEDDQFIKRRLDHFDAPSYVKAYGLDSIKSLSYTPEYITPNDNINC